MEQLRTSDRNAFNDLIYQHFKRLEIETEKWDHEREAFDSTIGLRDETIHRLEKELVEARQVKRHLEKAEDIRQQRTLQRANDRSLANKENIPEHEKRMIPSLLKTITQPIETQAILPANVPMNGPSVLNNDKNVEKLDDYASLMDKYEELHEQYQTMEKERDHFQLQYERTLDAHNKLIGVYAKNKKIWGEWIAQDERRRESSKKRPFEDLQGRARTTTPRLHTPDETPRPPFISPMKSVLARSAAMRGIELEEEETCEAPKTPTKKGGLFSQLKPAVPVQPSSFSGTLSRDIPEWGTRTLKKAITPPEPDSIPSDPPSCSSVEIPATLDASPIPPMSKPSSTTNASSDHGDDEFTPTSDAESDHPNGLETPRGKSQVTPEPMLPLPVPISEDETPKNNRKRGMTRDAPVVIKSEPQSSGPGYHLFEQETLDLDDVGDISEPPKKKTRLTPNPKHISLTRVENEDENNVPVLRSPRARNVTPSGIRTESHFPDPKTPEPDLRALLASTWAGRDNSPTTVRRVPISPQPISRGSPQHTPANKTNKRKSKDHHRNATVAILEDGTDGVVAVDRSLEVPDVVTSTRLDDILSTPMAKSPSLKMLGKETVNTRSAPTKRGGRRGGDVFDTPPTNTRHAQTDPRPTGKSTTDVLNHKSNKSNHHTPTAQSRPNTRNAASKPANITDFRVNPAANQGYDYAFKETVRNREERKCLPGCTKPCCREMGKFVEAAGLPVLPKGPKWRSSPPPMSSSQEIREEQMKDDKEREFVQKYGRHRDAFPRRRTPPGFWDSEFPDTQQLKMQNKEAEEMQKARVEEMRREAQKGARGRFTYR